MSRATPLQTVRALAAGYGPRVFQVRGWVLAAIVLAPVGLMLAVSAAFALHGDALPPGSALAVFHTILAKVALPILALIAAPAGIREDLEQRTLPLLLTRPAPAWALPMGKGLSWFAWGAAWIIIATLGLQILGGDAGLLPGRIGALVGAWWGELAFVALLGLTFKRGTLWAALWLFGWENLVAVFPPFLQRLTFTHYIESLAGSRGHSVGATELLAQAQVNTEPWLALVILFLAGLVFWAACGWKLHATPVGLAGSEAEG
ncbi:MAG TPA: hypothetical protein VFF76_10695 [Holophagaceae bacterium]|jgi:hypothetical protein|nr:hypothetical protein [Holophagaceae bacterium]